MDTFDTIVLPLDSSPVAETAVPYAIYLARITGASVVPLRVLQEMRPLYDARRREVVWLDPDHPRVDLMSPEMLQPVVERLTRAGVPAEPIVRLGDPRVEIVQEAGEHAHPLILLASHGRGGLGRAILGSVASRVIQTARCPVVVVRARPAEQQPTEVAFTRVGVLLDGSALAEQALPAAVGLARAAHATLQLMRVAETYRDELPKEPEPFLVSPSYEAILERFEQMENEARTYLSAVAQRLQTEGHTVTTRVYSGDPWREIRTFMEEEQPDLIAMTTHGRGGLARWFYGSVADKVLTSSEVPLLVIRAREQT